MSQSKVFESRILRECILHQVACVKIREDVRLVRGGPIRAKTEFDFAAGVKGQALFFDAKVCSKPKWNLASYVFAPQKIHQFYHLERVQDYGSKAGYLLWFPTLERITWVPVNLVIKCRASGVKDLTPETPGVRTQLDYHPLDLARLVLDV